MKIGIFDSGIGGEAVAASVRTVFPQAEVLVVNDREHVPYGDRTQDEIRQLTDSTIQPLIEQHCDIIVIACNTATAVAIEWLRQKYPGQLFIGLEPMIKPASRLTITGVITVCATPATLASERYARLKNDYGQNVTIIEPDCHDWARMIEDNEMNESKITDMVEQSKKHNADVIVLACTHYHWIREQIETAAGPTISVLDPSAAIVSRISELLSYPA
jgi:glutamate racemase